MSKNSTQREIAPIPRTLSSFNQIPNISSHKIINSSLRKLSKPLSSFEMRRFVQKCLTKFHSSLTRIHATKELQNFIKENKSPDVIRILFSYLGSPLKSLNKQARETELAIISFISSVFKESLLDPLDPRPSLLSSVQRLLEIVQKYFSIDSQTTRMACSRAWNEVYCNCLESVGLQEKVLLGFCNLENLIMEALDPYEKKTAAFCLYEFVAMKIYFDDKQFTNEVLPRIIDIFLKSKLLELVEITDLLNLVMEFSEIMTFSYKAQEILEKIYEELSRSNSKTTPNAKIALLSSISILCEKIEKDPSIFVPFSLKEITDVLKNACMDRTTKVQVAALDALKKWEKAKNTLQSTEERKGVKEVSDPRSAEDLIDLRANQTKERPPDDSRASKNSRDLKLRLNLGLFEKDIETLVSGAGWGANARGTNYMKKNGGYVGVKTHLGADKNSDKAREKTFANTSKQRRNWIVKKGRHFPIESEDSGRLPETPVIMEGNMDFVYGGRGLTQPQKQKELDEFLLRPNTDLRESTQRIDSNVSTPMMNTTRGNELETQQELESTLLFEEDAPEEMTRREESLDDTVEF